MGWLVLWIAVLTLGALGVAASVNSLRFGRAVAREADALWAGAPASFAIDPARIQGLPAPVRRYAARVLGGRARAVRTVRLRHRGTFRANLDGPWLPIRGREYFRADPPGFVWWGRARLAPGLWVEARDQSVAGVGHMLISAESTVTLADSAGPEMDQGALLRLLAELPWCPTALFDDRYVTWTAMDGRHARATLRVNGREATGVFDFGEDNLPAGFLADRYRDLGGGRSVLTPWSGEYGAYREVGGLLVPHRVHVAWNLDGQSVPYARFEVERVELDVPTPF